MTNVYQMFKNEDMEEGLGKDIPIPGLFSNREAAEKASVGRGVYGSPAVVKEIPVFDTAEDYQLWEKHANPDYQLFLKLKQQFGE